MNANQANLYWREWSQARTWYVDHGYTPPQADAKRAELTEQALGYSKSMSNWGTWKNAELDKVLAKFRSVYDGGNLDAQLNAEDQSAKRKIKALDDCARIGATLWPLPDDPEGEYIRGKKLNAIALRVCKKRYDALNDVELGRVLGVLFVQLKRVKSRQAHESSESEYPF